MSFVPTLGDRIKGYEAVSRHKLLRTRRCSSESMGARSIP